MQRGRTGVQRAGAVAAVQLRVRAAVGPRVQRGRGRRSSVARAVDRTGTVAVVAVLRRRRLGAAVGAAGVAQDGAGACQSRLLGDRLAVCPP